MTILFITVRSDTGGGPKHLLELLRRLRAAHPDWKFAVAAPLEPPNGPKFRDGADFFLSLPARRFSIYGWFRLARFVKCVRPTTIHSHSFGAGLYSRSLALLGVPVVHTFHGIFQRPGWGMRIRCLLDRLLRPLTARFICVSESEADLVSRLRLAGPERITIVRLGIDVDAFAENSAEARRKARALWDLGEDEFVLGTLTRFDYAKGVDLLMAAFDTLARNHPQRKFRLLIAGKSVLENQRAAAPIRFVGEVLEPATFLQAIDAYVSHSRWEGMPLAVLEAMSAGKPCVLSDIPAHREIASEAKSVRLFSMENPNEFAAAILDLSRRKLPNEGADRETVRVRHNPEDMIRLLTQIYVRNSA